jgi:hypothetical protein
MFGGGQCVSGFGTAAMPLLAGSSHHRLILLAATLVAVPLAWARARG